MIGKSSSTVLLKFANSALLKKAEEPEPVPYEGTVTVLKLPEGFGPIETGCEDIDWNENGRAASREGTL